MLPTIKIECSEFLIKSNNNFILKSLPKTTEGFKKVKVRQRNVKELFREIFDRGLHNNKTFTSRAVYAVGENGYIPSNDETLEPFYIFPINGFKFYYNPVVQNTEQQYTKILDKSLKIIDKDTVIEMFSENIKDSYTSENLIDGIKTGSEIIIYNIPYFYAVRKTVLDDIKAG